MGYILQPVQPLKSLALDKFGSWVEFRAENIEEAVWKVHPDFLECDRWCKRIRINEGERIIEPITVLSQNIKNLQSYLDRHMPRADTLHDTLVSKGIQVLTEHFENKQWIKKTCDKSSHSCQDIRIEIQKNVTINMIETLLTNDVTSLTLTSRHFNIFGGSLLSKSRTMSSMRRLTLALSPPKRDQLDAINYLENLETDILTLLQQFHNLEYFSHNSYCTENILRCLTTNCPLIEELDINNSGLRINDSSMEILTRLPNLKRVRLCGTSVGRQGIQTLLLSCKNIEMIDTGGGMSYILEHLASCEKYSGEQFKLKTFTASSLLKQLQLVTQMCPSIESITLSKHEKIKSNLLALIGLQKLSELKLIDYNFGDDYVREVLHIRGGGLSQLHLKGVIKVDLMYVSQTCPYLESLSIHDCTFTTHIYKSEMELKVSPFQNVKKLSLDNWSLFLMTNCLNVEVIHMDRNASVTEDLLLQILDKNPLICLKELIIWQRRSKPRALTTSVIDRIVRNCISRPLVIEMPIID